tara:strand:+ start:1267 stop:1707 length:441 start_codon:yes stop_codon:yes gene_type:complete
MWNNFIKTFLIFILFTSGAHASDGQFTFVQEGNEVPFTGTLFDPEATAKILTDYEFLKEDYKLELAYRLAIQKEEYDFQVDQLNITIRFQKEHYEASLAIYDAQVEDLRKIIAKKPNKLSSGLIIAGGFVVGVLTSVAIVYAVDRK